MHTHMKHEYKTTRIWIETLRKLKRIAADSGETIVALLDRLADAELQPNDFERAAKALDELITLRYLRDDIMDFNIVDDALRMIAQARRQNPRYPITVALADYMREHGYID